MEVIPADVRRGRGRRTGVERYKLATAEFVRGNPEPYKGLFSHREDVTLANPFFPWCADGIRCP